jgi:hypothetical protein
MPWSIGIGPLRYHQPRNSSRQPALLTAVLVMAGFAAVALLAAGVVLYGLVVAGSWLVGFTVGMFRFDPGLWASRYAMAVVNEARSWWRDDT